MITLPRTLKFIRVFELGEQEEGTMSTEKYDPVLGHWSSVILGSSMSDIWNESSMVEWTVQEDVFNIMLGSLRTKR
jgi:hypothetical protein